jgi:hypothetical protein
LIAVIEIAVENVHQFDQILPAAGIAATIRRGAPLFRQCLVAVLQ